MNINQLMQQAQKMQKDMLKSQEEVGKMTFTSKKDLVEVEVNGNKEVTKIILDKNIEKDDIEALEDMLMLAINEALKKADDEMEKKLGRYSKAMPGLF